MNFCFNLLLCPYLYSMRCNAFPMKYFSLILLAIILSSCLEGDDDSFRRKSDVLFVNVYNDAVNGIEFRVDDIEWAYGYRSYDTLDVYHTFYSGDVAFSAFVAGSGSGQAIASVSQTLNGGGKYTAFLTGKSGDGNMLFLPDTLNQPASGKALIRFVNLSPDLSKADIKVADSSTISSLDYLTAGYMSIDSGATVIRTYRAGEADASAALNFKAVSRGIYTMYTKGLASRTGKDSLAISYFLQP
ncbi:uncharacterized protein DUF4397 [Arcticibacter pallidicorallinus]|uniref:Uncharacterized protein DUF4397 n=2 Tax=Arcticibacter pallidicorallinus TaxID=1259464 RepID=A0A2T0U0Q0_9SPHI|nr:uncharacterized protein DUF4397 [Arcticibacter pallidicorallinus]